MSTRRRRPGALLLLGLLGCAPARGPRPQPGTPTRTIAARGQRAAPATRTSPGPRQALPSGEAAVLAGAAASPSPSPSPAGHADPLEMTFVGDVIFGRYREDGYDPIATADQQIFGEVGELLRSDLLIGNLETPVVEVLPERSPIVSRYSFGADTTLVAQLVEGGFGAMSLANNHAYDLRGPGIEQTPRILASLGIRALGAARDDAVPHRVETIEREGWRVGLVAVTTHSNIDGLAGLPSLPLVDIRQLEQEIAPLVEDARASHDLVVVLVHWGDEYADEPSWAQRRAAHALVEAGADLVIGHHPHVLQGIERYGHGLIAYSLGNFVFENVKDVPRQTGVLRTRFDARGCLDAVVFHPVFVKSVPFKHPAPAIEYMGGKIKQRVRAQGERLGSSWADDGDALVLEGPRCPAAPGSRAALAAP